MTKGIRTSIFGRRLGLSPDGSLVILDGSISPDSGTATATAGAATLAKVSGKITSEALTTAAGVTYTLTLTNTEIEATDQVYVSVAKGTATTGTLTVADVKPAAGSVVIIIQNIHASAAVNGTIVISFFTVKV
jgi:hypothetical protein